MMSQSGDMKKVLRLLGYMYVIPVIIAVGIIFYVGHQIEFSFYINIATLGVFCLFSIVGLNSLIEFLNNRPNQNKPTNGRRYVA